MFQFELRKGVHHLRFNSHMLWMCCHVSGQLRDVPAAGGGAGAAAAEAQRLELLRLLLGERFNCYLRELCFMSTLCRVVCCVVDLC